MLFTTGQKIVFIGDSITDCDRRGEAAPYGTGYVNLVRSLLQARYPQTQLTIVNKGIGGNTVRDLKERWQKDVIDEQPDWLSIKIGINDAYREISLTEYKSTLSELLAWTKQSTPAHLILMQPYLIEANRTDFERQRMDSYGTVIKELAAEQNAVLVETQKAFDEALETTQATDWASDRVHCDLPGHAVIALAFLRAIQFEL